MATSQAASLPPSLAGNFRAAWARSTTRSRSCLFVTFLDERRLELAAQPLLPIAGVAHVPPRRKLRRVAIEARAPALHVRFLPRRTQERREIGVVEHVVVEHSAGGVDGLGPLELCHRLVVAL